MLFFRSTRLTSHKKIHVAPDNFVSFKNPELQYKNGNDIKKVERNEKWKKERKKKKEYIKNSGFFSADYEYFFSIIPKV